VEVAYIARQRNWYYGLAEILRNVEMMLGGTAIVLGLCVTIRKRVELLRCQMMWLGCIDES
jgi:hypothetical protein